MGKPYLALPVFTSRGFSVGREGVELSYIISSKILPRSEFRDIYKALASFSILRIICSSVLSSRDMMWMVRKLCFCALS